MENCLGFTVDAVLPAGGVGQRMNSDTPKQFIEVSGKPIICYTLEAFERIPWIGKIAVPVASKWESLLQDLIKEQGYTKTITADGKSTRHRSIYEGVKRLKIGKKSPDVVIIHDAVRPLVEEDILRKVATAAMDHGASGAVRPLISTVVVKDTNGLMDHSLDRSTCRSSEMPQAFRYSVINEAYSKATCDDFEYGTECLQLARTYAGIKAKLVDGSENLWKVTHQQDIRTFQATINERRKVVVNIYKSNDCEDELYQQVVKNLDSQNIQLAAHDHFGLVNTSNDSLDDWKERLITQRQAGDNSKVVVLFLDEVENRDVLYDHMLPLLCYSSSVVIYSDKNPNAADLKEIIRRKKEEKGRELSPKPFCCGVSYSSERKDYERLTSLSKKISDLIVLLIGNNQVLFNGQIFEF